MDVWSRSCLVPFASRHFFKFPLYCLPASVYEISYPYFRWKSKGTSQAEKSKETATNSQTEGLQREGWQQGSFYGGEKVAVGYLDSIKSRGNRKYNKKWSFTFERFLWKYLEIVCSTLNFPSDQYSGPFLAFRVGFFWGGGEVREFLFKGKSRNL